MNIFIDGDGFPRRQREIALQAAERTGTPVIIVSDRLLDVTEGELVEHVLVEPGPDSADEYITQAVDAGDVVITCDIPLMGLCIGRGAVCVDHCGKIFTSENIGERISQRSFMELWRLSSAGPASGGRKRKQDSLKHFADALVKLLENRR